MFLMVKGARHGLIKGESQDDKHKGEIEVVSWSWGMQARPRLGSGTATGRATINDLKIVKRVDSASMALMSALRTNEPIQKAVLRDAGVPDDASAMMLDAGSPFDASTIVIDGSILIDAALADASPLRDANARDALAMMFPVDAD